MFLRATFLFKIICPVGIKLNSNYVSLLSKTYAKKDYVNKLYFQKLVVFLCILIKHQFLYL